MGGSNFPNFLGDCELGFRLITSSRGTLNLLLYFGTLLLVLADWLGKSLTVHPCVKDTRWRPSTSASLENT